MKKRVFAKYTLVLATGLIAGIMFFGCAGTRIRKLTGTEFQRRAQEIEQISSFNWITYIGQSSQRAYLEYGHPSFLGSGTRTTVFWTPLADLPDDLVLNLKAEKPPWTPWNTSKIKK